MVCDNLKTESVLLCSSRIPGQHADRKLVLGTAEAWHLFLGGDPGDRPCGASGI